jgi:hypothetical protein
MAFDMTKTEREQFLADLHVGILGISAPDRGPILIPVWYQYEPGGEVRFMTFARAKKVEHLRSHGRCSLCVQNEEPPNQYVSVEGPILSMEEADVEKDVRLSWRGGRGRLRGGDFWGTGTAGSDEPGAMVHRGLWQGRELISDYLQLAAHAL